MERLYEILDETTTRYRKGPQVTRKVVGGIEVVDVYDMPHTDESDDRFEMVDVSFMQVGVDKAKAEPLKEELKAILKALPEAKRFSVGPSYIEIGAMLGSQDAALALMALGQALGMWKVITPEKLGATGEVAASLAGSGWVLMTPWMEVT